MTMSNQYPVGPYGQETWGGYWVPAPTIIVPGSDSSKLRVPMSAQSVNYNELLISWGAPLDSFDGIALVRSSYGPPLGINDGVTVFLVAPVQMATPASQVGQGLNPFADSGLTGGLWYSYSLFLHVNAATPNWQRVGTVTAFVAKNYGTGNDLFGLLPEFYQSEDQALFNPNDVQPSVTAYVGQGPLQRYLGLVGLEYDAIRTEATNELEVFNPVKLRPEALLPAALTYGFPYEPYIGWRQVRLLWANWAYILKTKGTQLGVEAFVSSLTGYASSAVLSKNVMLSANDSEVYHDTGSWAATTAAATVQRDIAFSGATPGGPTPYANTIANVLVTSPGAGGDSTWHVGDLTTNRHVRLTAIPVTPTYVYAWSFGAMAAVFPRRDIFAGIAWYNQNGTFLSNSTGTPILEVGHGSVPPWLQGGDPTRPSVVAAAPAGAVYAIPFVTAQATAAFEQRYFTAGQFELVSTTGDLTQLPTSYEIARTIDITLQADRVNLALNPGLENDAANWITAGNSVISRSTLLSYLGTTSLVATSSGVGDFGAATTLKYTLPSVPPFSAQDLYSFSAFVRQNPADSFANAVSFAVIKWYSDPVVQIDSGFSATLLTTQVSPLRVPVQSGTWGAQPAAVTAVAPAGARSAQGAIMVTNAGAGLLPASTRVHIDGALFEKNGGGGAAFDGGSDPTSGEYLWEGTAGNSPSHHYAGKPLRDARLRVLLPDFLPAFSNWQIFYAQPTLPS